MRPRFSLKWLLVSFLLFGVALYLFFIRPTVIANQFVDLIQSNEYPQAEALCSRHFSEYVSTEEVVLTVRLLPRSQNDRWKMQRRMWLRIIPVTSQGSGSNRYSGSADIYAIAGPFGVRLDSR